MTTFLTLVLLEFINYNLAQHLIGKIRFTESKVTSDHESK